MAPALIAKPRPGFKISLCRVYYSCDVDGGRSTEDLTSRLRNLSAIELLLHFMCQHSHDNIHLILWQQTCGSL